MHEVGLIVVLFVVIGFSLLSRWIVNTIVTLPIVFTVVGLGIAEPLMALGTAETLHTATRIVAEITLILVLFSDASHVRFARLKESYQIPLRMLLIGMPLTIAVGTALMYGLSPEAGIAIALLTAAILTPTDAALGQNVVSSMDVPQRLSQAINVESGLNDGLALPFVFVGAILSSTAVAAGSEIASIAIKQVILGPLVGAGIGFVVARCLDWAENKQTINKSAPGVVFVTTAFAAYFLSELCGGNGFIAAFVAGAVFGNTYKHDIHFISEFMEGQGQLFTMAAFLVYGAVLLPAGIKHLSVQSVVVAIAFLTVVRMLPIMISLAGTGLALKEKLFLGWFGPRGLASILFALIIIDEYDIPHEDELLACIVMTVFLSIILHGISSTPLAQRIGKRSME